MLGLHPFTFYHITAGERWYTSGLNHWDVFKHKHKHEICLFQSCSESLSDHVSGEFVKMHQLLNDRELGLKEALENQREKNLAQMETKLKELTWKVASWSETLCRVRAGLEYKDQISFLKVSKTGWERRERWKPFSHVQQKHKALQMEKELQMVIFGRKESYLAGRDV